MCVHICEWRFLQCKKCYGCSLIYLTWNYRVVYIMICHVPKLHRMQSGFVYVHKLMLSICYHQCIVFVRQVGCA
jgi:hypothetical protein